MCEIHAAWPIDKITLYVESGEEPLAVEQPFANEEVVNDDDMHEASQHGDDVHEMHGGGRVDAEGGGGEDFDWLEEQFEGPNFDDDVFGNVDNGVSGRVVAPHRPSEGDIPANNDPPLEEGEWIDPPPKNDMASLVNSDDDLPAPTAAKEPEFNV